MSEARILAAFYQPKSKRFVSLTTDEVAQRCGLPAGHPDTRSLIARGIIVRQRLQGINRNIWSYQLSPGGERRVLAMAVLGTLPKPFITLTAKPVSDDPKPQAIPVTVRGQIFPSMSECARHFGISVSAVHLAVKSGKADGIGSRKKYKKPLDG